MKNITKKKRYSNFELLRILCIFMVIIQHISEETMLGGFSLLLESGNSIGYNILTFMYILSRVAVNVFILISGYFMINQTKTAECGKLINLFVMTSSYSLVGYFIRISAGVKVFALSDLFYTMFPKNYYVYLYVCLCMLAPYINKLLARMSKNQYQRLLLLLFFLFCIWSTISTSISVCINRDWSGIYTVSLDGSGRGFTIVSFIVIYIIGGYIRLHFDSIKHHAMVFWFACLLAISIILYTLIIVFPVLRNCLLNYDSIFIMLESICLFMVFINIRIGQNFFINKIGESTFGAFLLHYTIIKVLATILHMDTAFSSGTGRMMVVLIVIVILGFSISASIDMVLRFLVTPISRRWKNTRIFKFSIVKDL